MSIELYRIDERLLHGQVLIGWGSREAYDHYVIVDDLLAASDWEQELYAAGAPESVDVVFLSIPEALERLEEIRCRGSRGALLTRTTEAMRALAEAGLLEGRQVNVGGLHAAPQRREALSYVHLSPREVEDLRAIAARADSVSARDLPTAPEVGLRKLLSG